MNTTNHYCVPMALSILTGLPVEGVEKILKDVYLGDVEISGIYIDLALKFLNDNGYDWIPLNVADQPLKILSMQFKPILVEIKPILVEIKGHALVVKNGSVYDNSLVNGIDIHKYERRAERIVRAYRITKHA